MVARVVRRGWLLRGIEVSMSDGVHLVEYDGRGLGYEQVSVDGSINRTRSWWWYVPRFEFKVGGRSGVVEVRVWLWLSLKSLHLWVGDQLVFAEGAGVSGFKKMAALDDWGDFA
jgi:hypothetical protein